MCFIANQSTICCILIYISGQHYIYITTHVVDGDTLDVRLQDHNSRCVAVCYPIDGIKAGRNCNKMLVDAGHAKVKDFEYNEFEPDNWWS
jgi:endonuclease YncB( thermonuclease family)